MKWLLTCALAALALACPSATALAQADSQAQADPLTASVEALRDRFDAAYRDCGLTPPFRAEIKVETTPGLVTYSFEDRTVRTARFSELAPPLQGMMTAWAQTAGQGLDGEAQFIDIFNELLVPHEMGHWAQHVSRRAITLDHWEREVEANRIAIAFWSLEPAEAAALPARIEAFTGFLGQIPEPTPAGVTPRDRFNANYDSFDAIQYGWFQGAFMRAAWAQRDEADFCDLARLNAPAPPEAWTDD